MSKKKTQADLDTDSFGLQGNYADDADLAATADVPAPKPKAATAVSSSTKSHQRQYGGSSEIDHDLFKLELARALKNVSWTEEPQYQSVEHVHFFHTVDSTGRVQKTSTSVAGHFHQMTVKPSPDGGTPIVECSPAMVYTMRKVNGRMEKVAVELEHDQHSHEVSYQRSEKIQLRKQNLEFAKLQAQQASKEQSIPGIIG